MANGPTPDFNRVTLVWFGVNLDGSPAKGRLTVRYNGTLPMLDDAPDMPVSIYGVPISREIGTTQLTVGGISRTIGYAEFEVPASDDPDIQGSGGTYTLTEDLDSGAGRTVNFVASKDAPDGRIYLNRLSSVAPVPGETVTAVSVADFEAIKAQVALSGDPGSGGSLTTEAVQDIVGAMLRGVPASAVVYDDVAGTVTITAGSGTGGGTATLDPEAVRDTIGAAMRGVAPVSVTVNDAGDTITVQLESGTTGRALLATNTADQALALVGFPDGLANVAVSGRYGDLSGIPGLTAGPSGLLTINVAPDGSYVFDVDLPGVVTEVNVPHVVRQQADGTYPASPNVYKYFLGTTEPVPRADLPIGDYDEWKEGGRPSTPVAGTVIAPPVAPINASTWSWTLPTGIPVGQLVTFAVQTHTQAANTWTLKVGTRTIGEAVPTLLASGFAMRIYSFIADAATSGATVTMTTATALVNQVRQLLFGRSFGGLSVTPVITNGVEVCAPHARQASTVTQATSKASPSVATTATTLGLSFVAGASSAAPAPALWTPPTAFPKQVDNYYTGATAYLSGAVGADLNPIPPGSIPSHLWTLTDATGAAASALVGGYTLAYPVAMTAVQTHRWDSGAWHLMAEAV